MIQNLMKVVSFLCAEIGKTMHDKNCNLNSKYGDTLATINGMWMENWLLKIEVATLWNNSFTFDVLKSHPKDWHAITSNKIWQCYKNFATIL